jgi:hypothetical protein
VNRISKTSQRPSNRSPKLPDELHPIVDAVVEIVFERLRSATASATKGPPPRRKTARLALPLPKQRTALAEALADLLLADLASEARTDKTSRAKKRSKPSPAKASKKTRGRTKARPAAGRPTRKSRSK